MRLRMPLICITLLIASMRLSACPHIYEPSICDNQINSTFIYKNNSNSEVKHDFNDVLSAVYETLQVNISHYNLSSNQGNDSVKVTIDWSMDTSQVINAAKLQYDLTVKELNMGHYKQNYILLANSNLANKPIENNTDFNNEISINIELGNEFREVMVAFHQDDPNTQYDVFKIISTSKNAHTNTVSFDNVSYDKLLSLKTISAYLVVKDKNKPSTFTAHLSEKHILPVYSL